MDRRKLTLTDAMTTMKSAGLDLKGLQETIDKPTKKLTGALMAENAPKRPPNNYYRNRDKLKGFRHRRWNKYRSSGHGPSGATEYHGRDNQVDEPTNENNGKQTGREEGFESKTEWSFNKRG